MGGSLIGVLVWGKVQKLFSFLFVHDIGGLILYDTVDSI